MRDYTMSKELPSTRTVHFQVKDKGNKVTTEIILK